jgi:hypothetical protein
MPSTAGKEVNANRPKCERCFFYVSNFDNNSGLCHRYPPAQNAYSEFPGVHPLDWCGEFREGGDY